MELDKFDATRCTIQFRPPHFLSHIEQFKFEEEEPYKIKFKNAADRTRFIQALKYARLKSLEIMEAERERTYSFEIVYSNTITLKHRHQQVRCYKLNSTMPIF